MSTQTLYASGNWVNQDNATVLNGRLVGGSQFIPTPIPPGGGGTLSNLRIRRTTAPAAASSHTITVRKSGSGTAVTATIGAGANEAEDITHSVSFADTDTISIFTTKTGTPGSSDYQTAFDYTPDTPNLSIYGWGNAVNTSSEFHAPLFGQGGESSALEARGSSEVPVAGTLSSQAVLLKTAPGVGTSRIFTIRVNGVDQNGSGGTVDTRVTISGAATSGSASFSLSLAAGDIISIRQTVSGVPAGTTFIQGSVAFSPSSGSVAVAAAQMDNTTTNASTYFWPTSGYDGNATNATEANRQCIGGVTTQYISKIYMTLLAAAGVGKSWTCTLRNNGADTALAVTISGGVNTRGNATVSPPIAIASGDLWDLKFTPSGTPVSTTVPVRVALALSATSSAGPLFLSSFF